MLFNRIVVYGCGLAIVSAVAACSLSTSLDASLEKEVKAATVLQETAKAPTQAAPDDVVRVKNDIWLGDTSEIEFEGEPLPAYLENQKGITLISNRPITLYEIGDMINKITSIKVRFAPDLEESINASAKSNKPTPENIGVDWTEPDKMLVSYTNYLRDLAFGGNMIEKSSISIKTSPEHSFFIACRPSHPFQLMLVDRLMVKVELRNYHCLVQQKLSCGEILKKQSHL